MEDNMMLSLLAARKLLFVHGVRCAALLGIGGGSAARKLLFVHGVRCAALLGIGGGSKSTAALPLPTLPLIKGGV